MRLLRSVSDLDCVAYVDLYKYAKRTVDLLILDSAITSDVLLAKDR